MYRRQKVTLRELDWRSVEPPHALPAFRHPYAYVVRGKSDRQVAA
jgi:hypothetical protein